MAPVIPSDPDRVLTFLSLLDEEILEHTLRRIDPELAEQIRDLMTENRHARPSVSKQKAVLGEFARMFRFAVKYNKPKLKIHRGGEIEEIEQYELTDNAIRDLELMHATQVTSALEEETPRTAAILLKEMPHERTAEILSMMREDFRRNVFTELSMNPSAPPVVLEQVASTLVNRAHTLPYHREPEISAAERMAEVLRSTERKVQMDMLRTLKTEDEDLSAEVQKLLFRFADLPDMTDLQIRSVLNKVETSVLATALFEAGDAIVDKVFANLSKRARESLQEELGFLSNVPESQLLASRDTVGNAIAEVIMEGD